jgi:signal transduction histidine kinase
MLRRVRLALKLALALTAAVVIVFALHAWVTIRRDLGMLRADQLEDQFIIGRALRPMFVKTWRTEGRDRALVLLDYADERIKKVDIRFVEGDSPPAAVTHEDQDGEGLRTTRIPVEIDPTTRGAIEIAEPLTAERRFVRETIVWTLAGSAIFAVIAAAVAGVLGLWLVGRPLRRLAAQAQRVGAGDLSQRLAVGRRDELDDVAREMNTMCDRLASAQARVFAEHEERIRTIEQLRHADRLGTVGKLAAGVAHELGTPLNVVAGRAKLILGAAGDAGVVASASIIGGQVERMSHIVRQLLDFARRGGSVRAEVDLRAVAADTCELLAPMARRHGVTIALELPDASARVCGDPGQLQQVLANLVVNGVHAMIDGGRLAVRVELTDREVVLHVIDHGLGMSPDVVEHVFEPFFTTKRVGEGTGLGLAVSHGIVAEHGGRIAVSSRPGHGSWFVVHLPSMEQACVAAS